MNLLILYSMPINKDMTNKFGICPSTRHLSVLFPEKEAERTPSNKIFLAIVLPVSYTHLTLPTTPYV